MYVYMDNEEFVDLLMDRIIDMWNDGKQDIVTDLYRQYYEDVYLNWGDEKIDKSISEIVDNDWVNYTEVVTEDELPQYGYDSVDDLEYNGVILAEAEDADGERVFLISF